MQLNRIALAHTFGLVDLVLHPLFHLWVSVSPNSYEYLMGLFVAGLHLEVTDFDTGFAHIALGTLVEASIFWILGFCAATVYNWFARK